MPKWPLVSVILVAWNSRTELARCLPSLLKQDYLSYEIIIVDNASTDGTTSWLQHHFPNIRTQRNQENLGFAAAVNQGFALAEGDVLVELNPDTMVEPDWLFPLVEALQAPTVGLATPRIMLMNEPERVNACGNEISLTGLTFCIGVGEEAERFMANCSNDFRERGSEHTTKVVTTISLPVPAVSGAAFAMSRECYETIGGFDSDYFTYFEDTDLSWRARLAGFEVVLAINSVVYHDYEFRFSPQKMYWIERNRHLTWLKCLRKKTLLRLLPALLLGEAIVWTYALLSGPATLFAKARALGWLLRNWHDVLRRRASIRRKIEDDELVRLMTTDIRFDQTVPGALGRWMNRLIEPMLAWWKRKLFVKEP